MSDIFISYAQEDRDKAKALAQLLCRVCATGGDSVIEGSGRFANEVSAAIRDSQSAKSAELSEIARSRHVTLFHCNDAAEKLRDELRRMLRY